MKKIYFILIAVVSITTYSCYYDKEQTLYPAPPPPTPSICATVNAKFAADINPIIQTNCATPGCHNAGAAGGVVLLTYAQIKAKIDRIRERSLIQKNMPQNAPLSASNQQKLSCWIDNGAPNN